LSYLPEEFISPWFRTTILEVAPARHLPTGPQVHGQPQGLQPYEFTISGAIRAALFAMLPPLSRILIHDAPIYSTTSVTFRAAGYQTISVDFHVEEQLRKSLQLEQIQAVYIQHSRQQLTDHYVLSSVIQTVRTYQPSMLIIVDDNYAVANTPRIGVELGADISAFSLYAWITSLLLLRCPIIFLYVILLQERKPASLPDLGGIPLRQGCKNSTHQEMLEWRDRHDRLFDCRVSWRVVC
jgi:hypothetical protein